MANNPVKFSHPYPATARLFQQARLARLARGSLATATAQLSPTEGELLAAGIGRHVIPLNTDWSNILGDLFSLGKVRMVTAGSCAFIEKHGIYPMPEFSDSEATLVDNHMRIAIHLAEWGHAFAVFPFGDENASVKECGLHFFDRSGIAIHRIFLSPASSFEAFERIAEEYCRRGPDDPRSGAPQKSPQLLDPAQKAEANPKHVNGKFVRRVQNYEVLRALHNCQQAGLPIRISIGSPGWMQTHWVVLREIQGSPFWTCVIGDEAIFYIRDADITELNVVEARTGDLRSMSLCAFDAHGRLVTVLGVEETESQTFHYQWNHWLESLSDI